MRRRRVAVDVEKVSLVAARSHLCHTGGVFYGGVFRFCDATPVVWRFRSRSVTDQSCASRVTGVELRGADTSVQ